MHLLSREGSMFTIRGAQPPARRVIAAPGNHPDRSAIVEHQQPTVRHQQVARDRKDLDGAGFDQFACCP